MLLSDALSYTGPCINNEVEQRKTVRHPRYELDLKFEKIMSFLNFLTSFPCHPFDNSQSKEHVSVLVAGDPLETFSSHRLSRDGTDHHLSSHHWFC